MHGDEVAKLDLAVGQAPQDLNGAVDPLSVESDGGSRLELNQDLLPTSRFLVKQKPLHGGHASHGKGLRFQ